MCTMNKVFHNNNDLKRRIKELREENGYTKEQVANYLGVDVIKYSMYETGNRVPNTEKLHALRDLYKIRAELLGASLPICVKVEYPQGELENLEKVLRDVGVIENQTLEQLMVLQEALKKEFSHVLKIKIDALDLPVLTKRFVHDRIEPTIAEICSDARAESLFLDYFRINDNINSEILKRLT